MTRDELIAVLMEESEPDDVVLFQKDVFNPVLKPSGDVYRRSADTIIVDVDFAE